MFNVNDKECVNLIHPVHKTVFDSGYIVGRHPYLRHLYLVKCWGNKLAYYYDVDWIQRR